MNNTQLIDEDTIKRYQYIPKDYMMGDIITTIRHTTIEKGEKLISEEIDVTICFFCYSCKIRRNKGY